MNRRKSTHVPKLDDNPVAMDSSGEEYSAFSQSTRSSSRRSSSVSFGKQQPLRHPVEVIEISSETEELKENKSEDEENEPAQEDRRRRSMRHWAPNKRYTENFVQGTPKKSGRRRIIDNSEDDEDHAGEASSNSEDDGQLDELVGKVKATTLYEDRVDEEGQKIYGFKAPKKRKLMSILVSSLQHRVTPSARTLGRKSVSKPVGTPKTPKTPKTADKRQSKLDLAKTPHRVRSKLKKSIRKIVQSDSGSDFSGSDSDFVPSSEDEESDNDDEDKDSAEEEEEAKPKRPVIRNQFAIISIAPGKAPDPSTLAPQRVSNRIRRGKKTDLNYVLQSDDYFSSHSSSKVVTSDSTLDRLNTPRLPYDQLFRLLKELRGSTEHQRAIQDLYGAFDSRFFGGFA